ncbi:hypothetical protein, partial [Streptomyces chiangmaiensis]
MAERPPYGQFNSGSHFNQRGQHVYGPQYNADDIHVNHADPQSIADGMVLDRQRRKAEGESPRRRDQQARQARAAAAKAQVRLAAIIIAATFALMLLAAVVLTILRST